MKNRKVLNMDSQYVPKVLSISLSNSLDYNLCNKDAQSLNQRFLHLYLPIYG